MNWRDLIFGDGKPAKPFLDITNPFETNLLRKMFSDERSKEYKETFELYDRVISGGLSVDDELDLIRGSLADYWEEFSPYVRDDVLRAVTSLINDEEYMHTMPPRTIANLTLKEQVAFREFLRRRARYLANEDHYRELIHEALLQAFVPIARALPDFESPSPFTIPLINAVSNPKQIVQQLLAALCNPAFLERGIFDPVCEQLSRNLAEVSGLDFHDPNPKKAVKQPIDSSLSARELKDAYLRNTVFDALFETPVPLKLTHKDRFSHMHVLGGTGAGKTTLLENIILHDLKSADPPSLVIVDSQGDLIRKVSHLALMAQRNVILISPKDVAHPPALNIFDVNQDRLGKYDQATREQVIAGVIQTFDYVFTGLLGADLTAKQNVFFRYVARLMLSLPETLGRNATILDMMRLMEDPGPYQPAIQSLPELQRSFFERDFASKTFAQTKEQIRYRLHAIIENPTLARLFTSPSTKIDLFSELNKGAIILVDTAKDFLKGSSGNFGQIFISLVLQAILERAALPENQRKDTFLVIDEAAEYFDSNIDDLLTETRKFKCGLVLAHQYLEQATSSLRASLAANTSIKFAAGLSVGDARSLAPEMRTTPDFILGQPRLSFAAHIRNSTAQAVSVPVQVGMLEKEPQLSAKEYEALIERNRQRVSVHSEPVSTPSNPPGDEERTDW